MTQAMAPTGAGERVETLDVIRGFALLGILLMNIVVMGGPQVAYFNPAALGPPSDQDLRTWFVINTFFEGSMRTLFSMLFGAGFLLLMERLEARDLGMMGAKIYMRRIMLLMLMGLIDIILLLWSGDILFVYGVAALLLIPFWKSKLRGLVVWAVILFAFQTLFAIGGGVKFGEMESAYREAVAVRDAGQPVSEEQADAIRTWDENSEFWQASQKKIDESLKRAEDGWPAVAGYNAGELFTMEFGFFLMTGVFDALFAMLLGMIAWRIGLFQGRWRTGPVLILTAVGFGLGIPVNWWETQQVIDSGFSIHGFFAMMTTYHLGRVLLAMGWLGLVLLACKAPWLKWLRAGIGAVGRMALSNYLAHSIIAAVFFIGLGYYGELTRTQLYYVVFAMWAFNIVFSLAWLSVFQMGPAEWLWRAGTYGAWPKLFKRAGAKLAPAAAE
jgi:uncharacterized protein